MVPLLRSSSCQHYLEERVFFFPTQEAYYLDDLRGQSRTSLGAPNFATADAELWVHCAETIPERPFLPQCVHTYMIIVSFLLRFVYFYWLSLCHRAKTYHFEFTVMPQWLLNTCLYIYLLTYLYIPSASKLSIVDCQKSSLVFNVLISILGSVWRSLGFWPW